MSDNNSFESSSQDQPRREGGQSRGGRGSDRHVDRGNRGGRRGHGGRQDRGPRREKRHNPADIRRSNREGREASPSIDEDVTGKELDRPVQRELETLSQENRTWVAKHLVMAGRYVEDDPELAFQHALAASRRGGRVGFVREAVGITAYAAGEYAEALREFRTYRRITGDNSHLAEIVDSERALGRVEKALQSVEEADLSKLPRTSRVEVAMVVAGIHLDQDDPEAALKALEIPELDKSKAFPYSPRLFSAYADALEHAGRPAEAARWEQLSKRASKALGLVDEDEPAIIDLDLGPAAERKPAGKGGHGGKDRHRNSNHGRSHRS